MPKPSPREIQTYQEATIQMSGELTPRGVSVKLDDLEEAIRQIRVITDAADVTVRVFNPEKVGGQAAYVAGASLTMVAQIIPARKAKPS